MAKLRDRIVRNVPDVATPTIMRGTLIHSVIKQINANTIAIHPPRQASLNNDTTALNYDNNKDRNSTVDGEAEDAILDENAENTYVVMSELSRATSTVRVENPEDATQYVDVTRIDRVLMLGSDGRVYEMQFNNPTT